MQDREFMWDMDIHTGRPSGMFIWDVTLIWDMDLGYGGPSAV